MIVIPYLEPTIEPITKAELETHLGISSGTMANDTTPYSTIPATSYPVDYELMTLDVAPATAWAVGDTITGQTSSKTCIVVSAITTKTYLVKSRSGAFTLGEVVGVTGTAAKLADQGTAYPTFVTTYNGGYMVIGQWIEVLGHTTIVQLIPTANGTGGTVDAKIQECDVTTGAITDFVGGAFTQVTESNDTTIQELTYTGIKKYIRVVAKPLIAACQFSVLIQVWEPNVAEDDMLDELITAGRLSVENDTSKKIMQQTWDYCPKRWPDNDRIKIPFGNLNSVSSFAWKDIDGTVTTLVNGTDYTVEINGIQCGFVVLPYNGSWPTGTLHPSQPISIRFVCGYATRAEVPKSIKQAIKRWCANNYMNRGDDVIGYNTVSEDKTYSRLCGLVGRLYDMDFL
jgi:uncharacterized phiE125 gp8 family phage protein